MKKKSFTTLTGLGYFLGSVRPTEFPYFNFPKIYQLLSNFSEIPPTVILCAPTTCLCLATALVSPAHPLAAASAIKGRPGRTFGVSLLRFTRRTGRQTIVPPVVRTPPKPQLRVRLLFHDGLRRIAERPSAHVHQNDDQDRRHPLQQLFVRELQLVRRLDPVRQRHPPGLHQQRRVRYAKPEVARPFRGHAKST